MCFGGKTSWLCIFSCTPHFEIQIDKLFPSLFFLSSRCYCCSSMAILHNRIRVNLFYCNRNSNDNQNHILNPCFEQIISSMGFFGIIWAMGNFDLIQGQFTYVCNWISLSIKIGWGFRSSSYIIGCGWSVWKYISNLCGMGLFNCHCRKGVLLFPQFGIINKNHYSYSIWSS